MSDYLDVGYNRQLFYEGGIAKMSLDSLTGNAETSGEATIGSSIGGGASSPGVDNQFTTISPELLESGNLNSQWTIGKYASIKGGATGYDAGTGFFLGYDTAATAGYKFFIGNSAGNKLTWDGSTLSVTGSIFVSAGSTIAGFDIGSDYIRDVANSMGLASTVSGADDVRFWAGATFANRATAPFRVYESGAIVATSATITIATLGGFDIGSDYIRDAANSFGLASTVTGGDDVRFWAGAAFASRSTAPFRVTESGVTNIGNATDFVQYDGAILQAKGKIVAQQSYTTGHAIDQGDAVARESGAVYRTRVNNFGNNNTGTTLTINTFTPGTTTKYGRFIDVSSTVKFLVLSTRNATNDTTIARIVCSPSSSSVTSATPSVAINTTANIDNYSDGCLYTANKVCTAYTDGGGGALYGKVVSALDTTMTLNTEQTIAAACNEDCTIVPVSATEVLYIYTDASDNIVATSCTIDATTNAITVGATQTLLSDANVLQVRWAERFESTTKYCISFYDSTNTISYVMAFTYSAGSYSIGTPTSVVAAIMRTSMASMGTNAMVLVGSGRSYGILASGTTLTVSSNTAIGAGNWMYVTKMGKGNAVVSWRAAASTPTYQAIDMDTTSGAITLLGSSGNQDTTGGDDIIPIMVRLSPTRSIIFRDGTVNNDFKVEVIDWSSNFSASIGIAAASAASAASLLVVQAGESDDITDGVDGTAAYIDAGGDLTTTALGGSVKMGVYTGTTTIVVQV